MKSLILQKCIIKIVIGLILSFLWAQYLRVSTAMTMAEFPMIFLGAFYLMLAWFNYLKLDGVSIIPGHTKQKPLPKTKAKSRQMLDYVDTEIQDDPEIKPIQMQKAKLISNIICGVGFVIPSAIMALL